MALTQFTDNCVFFYNRPPLLKRLSKDSMAEVRTSRTAAAQAGSSLQAYREKYRLKIKSSSQNIGFYVECVECNEHSRTFRKVPEHSLGER